MSRSDQAGPSATAGKFASTHWSVVALAQDRTAPAAQQALATLCRTYWYPLYAYIRRDVGSADRAEELTQEFFARFLEKDFLQGVEQAKGKFRTFLLACCKHFLANQRDRDRAGKRGGGQALLSLDLDTAEQRYLRDPAHGLTAEKLFERRWALALLEQTLDRLGEEYQRAGKQPLYDALKSHLVGGRDLLSYAEVAKRLAMSEAAIKKAAQRLRQRYRALVREQILATVQGPEQLEDEIRDLFAILGG
jgi:RNA polymerase sigma-70 factor (ECF subfamily)